MRIVMLTVDDIAVVDGQVKLRIGALPAPVPEPLGQMLLDLVQERGNTNTLNAGSRWLFPGKRAGQPLHPQSLQALIRELGIPPQAARVASLRQLVLETPAPVAAGMLGYHVKTTVRINSEIGGPWKSYAPGDHTRLLPRV